MKYLVKQRMPNYIEHTRDEMEEGKIDSLNDIHNFEFMTFHRLQGQTMYMLTSAAQILPEHLPNWNVYVYDPTELESFKDLTWVARLYEIEDD